MSPSRRTWTAAAARWRPCWSSAARCTSATRSSPATPSGGSGRCSTTTASTLTEAGPSRPVQVLGFTSVPGAGDSFMVVEEDRVARQIAERRQARERNAQIGHRRRISLEDLDRALGRAQVEQLNLIIKGDDSGSVEALEDALIKIEVGEGEEVDLRVIHRGVGGITEDDINLATASDAIVIGFNVRPVGGAQELGRPRGRGHPVLHGDLPGHRRDRGRAQGHAQARVRGGRSSARRRSARSSGCRRIGNIAGCDRAVRARSGATPRRGWSGTAWSSTTTCTVELAPAVQGRRDRGPRGLRVRYRARFVQQHQDRGHDRDLRDAGEAAGVRQGTGGCSPGRWWPTCSSATSGR